MSGGGQRRVVYRDPKGKARNTPYQPGAFVLGRPPPMMQEFGVVVPPNVRAGQPFQCVVSGQVMMVHCPEGARGGQMIRIMVPVGGARHGGGAGGGGAGGGANSHTVRVPDGVRPGQLFRVLANGRYTCVTCPEGVGPGDEVRVVIKPPVSQMFEVQVPPGVRPGQRFVVSAGGAPVHVLCPPGTQAGQRVRFQHFVTQEKGGNTADTADSITFERMGGGWQRCLGVDGCMHWAKGSVAASGGVAAAAPFEDGAAGGSDDEGAAAAASAKEEGKDGDGDGEFAPLLSGAKAALEAEQTEAEYKEVARAESKGEDGERAGHKAGGSAKGGASLRAAAGDVMSALRGREGGAGTFALHKLVFVRQVLSARELAQLRAERGGEWEIEPPTAAAAAAAAEAGAAQAPAEAKAVVEARATEAKASAQAKDGDGDGDGGLGTVRLVPPDAYRLSLDVPGLPLAYSELAYATSRSFEQKVQWFQAQLGMLRVPFEEGGKIAVQVHRSTLLPDAFLCFRTLSAQQLRHSLQFEFLGEPGLDAGGLAREFYEEASVALFNADVGLFEQSGNGVSMAINPVSDTLVSNEDASHLEWFQFAGRLLGKALFDSRTVRAHLTKPLYMHLLGWPVRFADLEHVDADSHNSLKQVAQMAGDGDADAGGDDPIEDLGLDFTVLESVVSGRTVELCRGGADIAVTRRTLGAYLEGMARFKLLGSARAQTAALLQGFYEVVPEALLSVFDFQELELLLCGLPKIDVRDWQAHTAYRGLLAGSGGDHKVARWFWDVVENDLDEESRARLLQFATGTSGVPVQGFAALQGSQGVERFSLNGIRKRESLFPRAHTCFNRIDLPLYASRDEMKKYLTLAVQMEVTGFGLE
eukprot:g3243.t1